MDDSKTLLEALRGVLQAKDVQTDSNTLQVYATDYSHYSGYKLPTCIAYPRTEEQTVAVVKICAARDVAIIGYGTGTSLEGHISVVVQSGRQSVILSFERMRKLLKVHKNDLDCVVEPGLSFVSLNKQLKRHGLYFPLDAGPAASIGGMAMTSASGTKACRYGTMKENVLGLRMVLANGDVVKTANRARKMVAGYDLTHVFVGSEGTLGLATQITLRVYRIPEFESAALIPFPTLSAAADAVIACQQQEVQVIMLELMDALMIEAMNLANKTSYPVAPTLYIQMGAMTEVALKDIAGQIKTITVQHNAGKALYVSTAAERAHLLKLRKSCLFATRKLLPPAAKGEQDNVVIWTTDVCVPISQLSKVLADTHTDLKASCLHAPLVAHAGDGNFHLFILFDETNQAHVKEAKRINENLIQRAIAMDGTCTGEHGVGIGKIAYLERELGK
jgi:D-lactate dehydrogenase (cytochrome)